MLIYKKLYSKVGLKVAKISYLVVMIKKLLTKSGFVTRLIYFFSLLDVSSVKYIALQIFIALFVAW